MNRPHPAASRPVERGALRVAPSVSRSHVTAAPARTVARFLPRITLLLLLLGLLPVLGACSGSGADEGATSDSAQSADAGAGEDRGDAAKSSERDGDKDGDGGADEDDGGEPGPTPTYDRRVERVVTADGALELPIAPQPLSFATSGEVLEVTVSSGDPVEVGDLLARVNPAALDGAVLDAQASLTSAREGLTSAGLALQRAERGTDVETGRLEVERSKNSLWSQQVSRDSICGRAGTAFTPQSECDGADASVQAAEQSLLIAQESYQATLDARESELAAARARVASARANIAQAERGVARADIARADAAIVAPFAGIVDVVHVAVGVNVGPGSPAVTVAKTTPLDFVTSNLGERYVGDVVEGAPAEVTLTAWPDRPLSGRVRRIASTGSPDGGGAIVYRVWISVDETDLPLRAGMTGRVEVGLAD